MSVERRGNNNNPTVQRRGEKNVPLPNYKREVARVNEGRYSSDTPAQDATKAEAPQPNTLYGVRVTAANFDTKAFEERVRARIAYYEANPKEKKEFLKKFEGWIGKAIFVFIIMFAIPPLAGLAIAFGLFYLFLMSLKPKDPNRTQKMQQIAEDIAVAVKLKQVK